MAPATQDNGVAAAIERVLDAEREAERAIAAAVSEAEAELQAARDTRRRILDNARVRATRMHAIAERGLSAALARVEREVREMPQIDATLDEQIERAVRVLAAHLTTQDHAPD